MLGSKANHRIGPIPSFKDKRPAPQVLKGIRKMSSQPGKALKHVSERRRRRYPRYRSEFPVTLTLFSGQEHQSLQAHCRDLSAAGIGILLAAELTVGEVVALAFSVPGLESWKVRAVLRHRRGYHYGFEFLSLSDEQNKALTEYLPKLERTDAEGEPSSR
jgi:c-di-GMP-binding flagellar brake protein YcgR